LKGTTKYCIGVNEGATELNWLNTVKIFKIFSQRTKWGAIAQTGV